MAHTLFFENTVARVWSWVKEHRHTLLAGLIFGLLAHGYFFTNKLVNHDEIVAMFGKGATFTSGRWALGLLSYVLPDFSMPWIYGILSVLIMAVAVCVIADLLGVKSKYLQILLAGLVMVFPAQSSIFCYMFTSAPYALSILLAVLSVHFLEKGSKGASIPAAVLLVFSLGIYQAFISFASTLMLVLLMKKLLEGTDAKAVLRRGLGYLLFLIICVAVYAGLTWAILQLTGIEFNTYAAGAVGAGMGLGKRFVTAYKEFAKIFFTDAYGLLNTPLIRICHWVLGLLGAIGLGTALLRKGSKLGKVLLLLCVMLLPLSICCFFLLTPYAVHTIVLFSFVCLYGAAVVLLGQIKWADLARNAAMTAMAVIIVCNIYVSNTMALELELMYENTYAFYSSLVTQVKQTPGYDEHSKLALVGDASEQIQHFSKFTYDEIVGVPGNLINAYSRREFIQYYIGFATPFATDEEVEALRDTQEVSQMPQYPYYGSVQKIGEYIVVHLGD